MTFEEWWNDGARSLEFEDKFDLSVAAYNAGYTAFVNELCDKCGKTRQQVGGGCIHCITEWCKQRVKKAEAERDELLAAQYMIAQRSARLAIERCKNATGARRKIEMFVSENQCAEDILEEVAKGEKLWPAT